MDGRHIVSVAQGVTANVVYSAVCAGSVAIGLRQAGDFNDLSNWPIWLGLVIGLGTAGFVGSSVNTARLWWKKRKINPAPGDRLTIILTDLVGDNPVRLQKQNVRDSLERCLGASIHIITFPQALHIDEGLVDAELSKTHARAQRIFEDKRGDILIWGRVKSADALALYFTGRSAATSKIASPYMLVSDPERALELPYNFDRDLGVAIAARVIAVVLALGGREGTFTTPYADRFAKQLAAIVIHPKPNWTPDARAAVLYAYGWSKIIAGREQTENTFLQQGADSFRAALTEFQGEPLDRAVTQMNLGRALAELGQRESGSEHLEEAVVTLRAALHELTRNRVPPLQWALAQEGLGVALLELGERESGTVRLKEAAAAFRAALEERTQERAPLDWALTQNNLGVALRLLAGRDNRRDYLEEAVTAFHKALGEFTRARVPLFWAMVQQNLGTALEELGERESGPLHLKAALAAFRRALSIYTRDRLPLKWADCQSNLGNALVSLSVRERGPANLRAAVAAFRGALEVVPRDRLPLRWAMIQMNLGNALLQLGERTSAAAVIKAASSMIRNQVSEALRTAFSVSRKTMDERTGDQIPSFKDIIVAARTGAESAKSTLKNNQTIMQAQLPFEAALESVPILEEAIAAYRLSLEERTRNRLPFFWAEVQLNIGNALLALGKRETGTARLEDAVAVYGAALEELTHDQTPLYWAISSGNQGVAQKLIAERVRI
jgi:tetratricopeptide (TPR) repeat protein